MKQESVNIFMELISDWDIWKDENLLYRRISEYLKNNFAINFFVVLSYPQNLNDFKFGKHRRFRGVFHKADIVRSYQNPNFVALLDHVDLNALELEFFTNQQINGEIFYLLYFGGSEGQKHFAVAKGGELEKNFFHHFTKYFALGHIQLLKREEYSRLSALIHIDDITGLFNQRRLQKDLDLYVKRYTDFQEHFCVLFIDIDHFKNVNDGHGHIVGTRLLELMADVLRNTLREADLIYRYGGDEFVLIIPDSKSDTAKLVGERVLKAIKEFKFVINENVSFYLSVSIGVAEFPQDADSKKAVLEMADKMMYHAKNGGRGMVCEAKSIINKSPAS